MADRNSNLRLLSRSCELRIAARGGRAMGQALSRRTQRPVRVVTGQIWRILADYSDNPKQAHAGQRPGKIKTSDAGNVADGQDRYRQIAAGIQRRVRPTGGPAHGIQYDKVRS